MLLMHNLSYHSLHQMESAICLRYRPFPYVSKGFEGASARPSRFHLRFNHATPVSLPHFSTPRGPITRSFRHATCMLERFSEPSHNNKGSGNKILRGMTGASLVLACVLGLLNFSGKVNTKFTTAYADSTSKFGFPFSSPDKNFHDVRDALNLLLKTIDETKTIEKELIGDNKSVDLGDPNTRQNAAEFITFMFQGSVSDRLVNLYCSSSQFEKLHAAVLILYKAIVEQALEKEKPLRKPLRKHELKAIIAEATAKGMEKRVPQKTIKALPEWTKALNKIYNNKVTCEGDADT
ncbi:hypothetical protein Fmac_004941 [Flemingia macrophylla]|uniref:Uncharacterized protein n=1 Tax=Flemingia macrophylla TaxID=520843 RepID=A0ABD1N6D8_9FABA